MHRRCGSLQRNTAGDAEKFPDLPDLLRCQFAAGKAQRTVVSPEGTQNSAVFLQTEPCGAEGIAVAVPGKVAVNLRARCREQITGFLQQLRMLRQNDHS